MKKITENSNSDPEIKARIVNHEYREPSGHPFRVFSHDLLPVGSKSEGSDPYNKPAPPPPGTEPEQQFALTAQKPGNSG